MGQERLLNQPWPPLLPDFSCQLLSLSQTHPAPWEEEGLSTISWGRASPRERKAEEAEPQPTRGKELLPTVHEDAGGRRDPLSHPVAVAAHHQSLSPVPLTGPTGCPPPLWTLCSHQRKRAWMNLNFTAPNTSGQMNQKAWGVSPLSRKI